MKRVVPTLAALAALAGVIFAARGLFGSGPGGPGPFLFVDVETGRVFKEDPGAFAAMPAKNARNGKETIYPVMKTDDGALEIPGRHRDLLVALAQTMPVRVDLETFRVEP